MTVGNDAVQQVIAAKAIYNCPGAVVITNSTFTPEAEELARVRPWRRAGRRQALAFAIAAGVRRELGVTNEARLLMPGLDDGRLRGRGRRYLFRRGFDGVRETEGSPVDFFGA